MADFRDGQRDRIAASCEAVRICGPSQGRVGGEGGTGLTRRHCPLPTDTKPREGDPDGRVPVLQLCSSHRPPGAVVVVAALQDLNDGLVGEIARVVGRQAGREHRLVGVRPRADSTVACPGRLVPEVGVSAVAALSSDGEEHSPVISLGVDPHRSPLTATGVESEPNQRIGTMQIEASLTDFRRLPAWARRWPQRRWAVENADGPGRHLAQWLIARGESVVDVLAAATSRVRELSRRGRRKNGQIGAAATATATCPQGVEPEDHTTALALLDELRVNLAKARVRTSINSTRCCVICCPAAPRLSYPRAWPPNCCDASVPSATSRPSARTSPGIWSPRSGNWTSSSRTMLPVWRASWRHRAAPRRLEVCLPRSRDRAAAAAATRRALRQCKDEPPASPPPPLCYPQAKARCPHADRAPGTMPACPRSSPRS